MTAANYAPVVLPFTLRYEGGKVDNPKDPGGRTNEGVTQRTFTAALAKRGQPSRDVYTMTDAERDAIYRGSYWIPVGGDLLPDGVDLAVFDYGVNSGPSRALKAWGRRTSSDAVAGVKFVCDARLSFDRGLAIWNTFKSGWTARVAACEALGVKMAEHASIGVPVTSPTTAATATKLLVTSQQASAAAKAHSKKGTGVATLMGAGGATQTPATPASHLPLMLLVAIGTVSVTAILLLLWRAHQQKARAAAYAAVAAEALVPTAPANVPIASAK